MDCFSWVNCVRHNTYSDHLISHVYTFLPTRTYWFIAAITLFYAIFYFIAKINENKLGVIGIITLLIYFIIYFSTRDLSQWSIEGNDYFKYIYYFGVMLCGFILRRKNVVDKMLIENYGPRRGVINCVAVISLGMYLLMKLLMLEYPELYKIQFIVQGFTLTFGVSTFLAFILLEPTFSNNSKVYNTVIKGIGNSTLEIYLLNYVLADCFKRIVFPLNIIFAFISILTCGYILHMFVHIFTNLINVRIVSRRNK